MGIILRYVLVAVGSIGIWAWIQARYKKRQYPDVSEYIRYPNVSVESLRIEDDAIALHWRDDIQATQVAYYINSETDKHVIPLHEQLREVVIQPVAKNQLYHFELMQADGTFLALRERVVPCPNIKNLRDIGGYPTRDGRVTRWGQVYRSASLRDAQVDDFAILTQLGIASVCDIRTHDEVEEAPDRLPADVHYQHYAPENNFQRWEQVIRITLDPNYFDTLLLKLYTEIMLDQNAHIFGDILRRIADEQTPLLVHCSAGKDRTGITIALLLRLLGVDDEIILADYSLSNAYFDYFRDISASLIEQLLRIGINESNLTPVLSADPEVMQKTLAYLDAHYGSVENYLLMNTNLTQEDFECIRQTLLVPIA
jgi:protein-tyrosine phosphatase